MKEPLRQQSDSTMPKCLIAQVVVIGARGYSLAEDRLKIEITDSLLNNQSKHAGILNAWNTHS